MLFKTVALLALASTTFARAHPKRHDYLHHHSGSRGLAYPTGENWNAYNSTGGLASTAAALASTPVSTMTVVPLQESAPPPAGSAPAAPDNVAVVEGVQNVDAAAASSCSSTSTTYTTEWITMTVSPPAGAAEGASTGPPASSPTLALIAASAPASDSISLVVTSSVVAGGFYQHSSYSFPGAASSPAAVPTTFATSPAASGAAPSGGSTAASSATVPSSTGTTGPSTGGKKGLSYNDASLTNAFAGQGISWAYNWGQAAGGTLVSGAEFVPMLWGLKSTSGWSAAAQAAISSGSSHLLSFNEPDLSSQSNIDPATAATTHITYMNPLAGNGVQIGSPAVTNGAGTSPLMGIDWLSAFFAACAGNCKVDFVAFHWYATASSIDYFKQHVQDVINTAAAAGVSKVWLTEFQASGSDAEVQAFLAEALPFLDSTPAVERYAYFECAAGAGNLVSSGTSLSTIGQAYAG